MSTLRVLKNKDNPFVMINKHFIYDSNLSMKAKGLMCYFLSRPDDWEFFSTEIEKHCIDKKDSIRTGINELIDNGYIERKVKRSEKGKFDGGYEYLVYEIPRYLEEICSRLEQPDTENPNPVTPNSENPPLLNNDNKLNNELKLNNINIYSQVIQYLNEKANTNFKDNSKATKNLINGRTKEGYTLEDFKTVIDKKVKSWIGTEWENYLRPSTLFTPKNFENYLNEKIKEGSSNGSTGQNNATSKDKEGYYYDFSKLNV